MKKFIVSVLTFAAIFNASAEELNFNGDVPADNGNDEATEERLVSDTSQENNWGRKLTVSPFGLGLDLQTKYVWRGMEMMAEESAPVLFPSFNYSNEGLYLYAMGGYAINGKYAEVDLGASYTYKCLTVGFNDYYYPTVNTIIDEYLGGWKHTGHWLEACVTYAPEIVPVFATLSSFFAGADKYVDERNNTKQAHSTYIEIGTYYGFLKGNRITLTCGMALNKSCYNGYEHNFSVCNLESKYTYNVEFNDGWKLPLSAAFIYNPLYDKSDVNFTASIAF